MKLHLCLIFVSFKLIIAQDPTVCNDENLATCTEPLARFNLEQNTAIVPTQTVAQMREVCNTYDNLVESCLQNFIGNCPIGSQLVLYGIDLQYAYLCDHTFDTYETHRDCLAKEELHVSGASCLGHLNNRLTELNNTIYDDTIDNDLVAAEHNAEVCIVAKTYLDCVENVVQQHCGNDAASWQRTFDTLSLGPTLQSINCDFIDEVANNFVPTSSSSDTMVIAFLLCFIVLVLIIFLVSLGWWYKRKRNRAHRNAIRNTQLQVGAYPYVSYPDAANGGAAGVQIIPQVLQPPSYSEKGSKPPQYTQNQARQSFGNVESIPNIFHSPTNSNSFNGQNYQNPVGNQARDPHDTFSITPSMSASQVTPRY